MFERLPVPFGLVRYGVSPLHADVKNVTHTFSHTARNDNYRFIGNVKVGKDIQLKELLSRYHAVVLAYGSHLEKKLGIPGEDSQNVISSNEFVAWYNGHPDAGDISPNFQTESAVLVGNGNVSLDIARILLSPIEDMRSSDISPKALESLKTSRIKRVIITGRRGPLQSAFTTKELREILAIPEMRFKTDPKLLDEQIAEATEYLSTNRPKKRLVELIRKGALQTASKCSKSLEMLYNANPAGFRLDSTGSVSNIILQRTVLQGQVPDVKCVGTKEFFDIDCGLVIKSVGFNTEPLEGLPFDEGKNRYFNDRGKVKGVPGLYVSGWLKSGPVGVIASTMYDAFETADTILMDSPTLISSEKQGLTNEEISSLGATSFADWESLDTAELKRGKEAGKARVKVESIEEMVSIMRDT